MPSETAMRPEWHITIERWDINILQSEYYKTTVEYSLYVWNSVDPNSIKTLYVQSDEYEYFTIATTHGLSHTVVEHTVRMDKPWGDWNVRKLWKWFYATVCVMTGDEDVMKLRIVTESALDHEKM